MTHVIGTCSRCKGPVTVPSLWGGILPPTPVCSRCGATPTQPHGSVIPMDPPAVKQFCPRCGLIAGSDYCKQAHP
jgi:hypothetical protein